VGAHEAIEAMKVFFDLDGTLLDASDRLYQLFQFLVPISSLTKEEYWKLKRNKITHQEILHTQFMYNVAQIREFENTWLSMIELPEWITLDKPFPGITKYLHELKKDHALYIVTARQSEETAVLQIKNYGWSELFEDVLVTKQRYDKSELVKMNKSEAAKDWIIGDTGKDIETGKKLGLRTAAVLSGFLNKERLMEYQPDIIANFVTDLTFTNQEI
jgi:phosphoglycolate phosphatase